MIKVTGLKKHFGDLEVLKGIDQHIKQGEKVVVIGPSGSGKSTFLRCLNLLEVPTEGEILIEGESITAPKTNVNKIRASFSASAFGIFLTLIGARVILSSTVRCGNRLNC